MVKKVFMALALTAGLSAQAQIADDSNLFNHLSVGVSVGTPGIGIELGTTICPYVTMRAGVDIMPKFTVTNQLQVNRPEALKYVSQELLETRYVNIPAYGAKIDVKGQPNKTQGRVLFDIYPTKNSVFHFTVGAAFGSSDLVSVKATDKTIAAVELYNNDVKNGIIAPEPNYEDGFHFDIEGYKIVPDQGRIRLDARVNSFRPYFGIGVGRTVPRHRIGCKFEAGVEYWGKPKLVDAYANNGAGYTITENEPGISKEFADGIKLGSGIPVYPTLKLTINGRLF